VNLGEQHANVSGARRRLGCPSASDRQARRRGSGTSARRIGGRSEIGDRLQIGFVFDQLFRCRGAGDRYEGRARSSPRRHLEHQPHDAMRCGVLRPKLHVKYSRICGGPARFAPRSPAGGGASRRSLIPRPGGGALVRPEAFSSPAKSLSMPSQGEMKIEACEFLLQLTARNHPLFFWSSSYSQFDKAVSGNSCAKGNGPSKP